MCVESLVLRYSPYSQAVSEIVRSVTLGQLINVVHVEPIGHYHFAHSYVRGNWSQEEKCSFSLMTKSCQWVITHLSDRRNMCVDRISSLRITATSTSSTAGCLPLSQPRSPRSEACSTSVNLESPLKPAMPSAV